MGTAGKPSFPDILNFHGRSFVEPEVTYMS